MRKLTKKERFKDKVLSKFQVYNSIFSTLPYESISNTGVMLPLFEKICIEGYEKNNNPTQIVDYFFSTYLNENSENEKIDLLFQFIQYIERQVVLFDAVEDAAFSKINNLDGIGTLRSLKEEVIEIASDVLARSAPSAAFKLMEVLNSDRPVPQANVKLQAAQTILDRVGLGKQDRMEVNHNVGGGIFILPEKQTIDIVAEDGEYEDISPTD